MLEHGALGGNVACSILHAVDLVDLTVGCGVICLAYDAPGAVTDSSTAASSLPSQRVLAAKVSDTAPSVRYWLYMDW